MHKMTSKIYFAIILSDYQELNLIRYVNYFNIKDKIILIKRSDNKKNISKFPKNVKKKIFSNKYAFLFYFFLVLFRNSFYKKKFIFGNPAGKFCIFLRKFINGKNQIYVDDGLQTIYYDFSQLKKNCTIFTLYNINLPSKIKKIQYFPKYLKKRKKTFNKYLFIGAPLVSFRNLSSDKYKKILIILSNKNKKFYYYPHRNETIELSLLPNNFKIIRRSSSVEKFVYNYKYNFKAIYSFGSSCLIEISNFYKKENIKIVDIVKWIEKSDLHPNMKNKMKIINDYLRKLKINTIQLNKNNT